jgi:hypothetical protein
VSTGNGGYEFKIGQRDSVGALRNSCGGEGEFGTECPNCKMPLFSMFSLATDDEHLRVLRLWRLPRLELLVCPRCALFMKPYWVVYSAKSARVLGGERDGGETLSNIEYPFQSRRRVTISRIRSRKHVMHQLGGPDGSQHLHCASCRKPMRFGGVIGYDDQNVPLYEEGHRPVALIIGDCDSLYWFTCLDCAAIGFRWVY